MFAPPIKRPQVTAPAAPMLRRNCACGAPTKTAGACETCSADRQPFSVMPEIMIGAADDPLEREADRVADLALAGGGADFSRIPVTLQRRAAAAPAVGAFAPPSVHDALAQSGRPLDAALRRGLEPRFGFDFSQVRIHDNAVAGQSAREVGAVAYSVANNIVFRPGLYAPETQAGRHLLAHELAHVAQQGATPAVLRRKSEIGLCGGNWTCAASPCQQPDPGREGNGEAAKSWSLKVFIDVEAPTARSVTGATVGHTFVEIADSSGKAYTFGFYPNGMPIPGFRNAVPGCVVHPDTGHKNCVDYVQQFSVTQEQHAKALSFASEFCRAPEPYHILNNNCTTFALRVALSANRTLPESQGTVGGKFEADNPNTLYEGLRQRDLGSAYTPTPDTSGLVSDTDIRTWAAKTPAGEIAAILPSETVRIVNRLIEGWVSDDDLTAIEKICAAANPLTKEALYRAINPLESSLWSSTQQKRLHNALAAGKPAAAAKK